MNVANIKTVAAALRTPEIAKRFDMSYWFCVADAAPDFESPKDMTFGQASHVCGTVGCIAGWTAAILRPNDLARQDGEEARFYAALALDLDMVESQELFVPYGIDYSLVTAPIAANVLDRFAETGEIVWPAEVSAYDHR